MPHTDGRPTYAELAEAAGIKPTQVKRDKQDGAPQRTIAEYLAWRSAHRQERNIPHRSTPIPASGGINSETARLRRLQADREELEIAKARGQLVPAEDVRQTLLAAGAVFASQLDALPARLAHELVGITDVNVILERIRVECDRVREATAAQFNELADDAAASVGEDGGATAAPDAGSVGGSDADSSTGLGGAGTVS